MKFFFFFYLANNCLTLLVNQLQNNLIHNMESLLPYITTQVTTENLVSDKFVLSLLGIIQKVSMYIFLFILSK